MRTVSFGAGMEGIGVSQARILGVGEEESSVRWRFRGAAASCATQGRRVKGDRGLVEIPVSSVPSALRKLPGVMQVRRPGVFRWGPRRRLAALLPAVKGCLPGEEGGCWSSAA